MFSERDDVGFVVVDHFGCAREGKPGAVDSKYNAGVQRKLSGRAKTIAAIKTRIEVFSPYVRYRTFVSLAPRHHLLALRAHFLIGYG